MNLYGFLCFGELLLALVLDIGKLKLTFMTSDKSKSNPKRAPTRRVVFNIVKLVSKRMI